MKPTKRQKKGHISEEDMSNLLHRYSAQKVLTLLQEVSQSAEAKMDWNALVKKTATGITSAREYQMLWRHIAYCQELIEGVDDDAAEALDDDSDLEYELEAYPAVSPEASAEAAACVKVLIGDSEVPNSSTVEAPLTINIPSGQSSKPSLENSLLTSIQGTIITVPVSVQKQPILQGSVQKQSTGEGSDANGLTNIPRRKRKPWSEDEDRELRDAVAKCGEGNWVSILKGDFKGERTAPQLSQRWATLKRKLMSNTDTGDQIGNGAATSSTPGTLNPSNEDKVVVSNTFSQPPQSQSNPAGGNPISSKPGTSSSVPNPRAPPKKAPLTPLLYSGSCAVGNGAATSSNPGTLNPSNKDNAVVNNTLSQPPQSQPNPAGGNPISSKPGSSSSVPNPRAPPKKAPLNPLLNKASSMVAKAAVANNAVHIIPKGGSTLVKSSVTNTSNPTPSSHLGPVRTTPFGSHSVRANLVRPTTPSPASSSVPISRATGSQPLRRPVVLPAPSAKASASSTLRNNSSAPLSQPSQVALTAIRSSSQTKATVCQPAEVKKEAKTSEVMKAPPPHPLARPLPAQKIEAQQNPSPVSSSAELVASTQETAKSRDSAVVNVVAQKGGDDLKNKNESLVAGKA